jgi:hypothetical protein
MLSANEQRTRARGVAQEGIQQLLDAGLSFKRVAEPMPPQRCSWCSMARFWWT